MGALGFLLIRSARNRVVTMVTRLRSPRYAVAVLVAVGYFVLVFGNPANRSRNRPALDPTGTLVMLAPLALAALVAWWWMRGGFEGALAFKPAEVDFLFPAPIRRRTLIAHKMMRAQPGLLLSAAFFTVIFPVKLPLSWPLAFVSLWLILTTLQWHQLASSLVRANVAKHGTSGTRRSALSVVILLAALAALLTGVVPELPALRASSSLHELVAHVGAVLQRPGPRVVLYPFRALLAPIAAPDALAWLRALPAVLVMLALHFVWVLRMDAAFEEAAAEAGRKREALRANRRRGLVSARATPKTVSRPWFGLAPTGRPGTAILWKNALVFTRQLRPGTQALVLLLVLIAGVVFATITAGSGSTSGMDVASSMVGALLVGSMIMSPVGLRNDLRGDLRHMELLRTYPIRGRELVTGEIAGSTAGLAFTQGCLLVVLVAFAAFGSLGHAHPLLLAVGGALSLPLIVTVAAVQCAIQNALAIFFPAWVHDTVTTGIEGFGHRILAMLGSMLLLVLMLLPALVLGGAAFVGAGVLWGPVAGLIAAGVVSCAVLWGEIAGTVVWLGRAYDRLDPVDAGIIV
jgi:hypothetical protein